jgi:hypothetical protein
VLVAESGEREVEFAETGVNGFLDTILQRIRQIGTWTSKIVFDHGFEVAKNRIINGKLPLEVRTHLALHLVDVAKVEHALSDDGPRLVAVCVIADDF